MRNPIFKGNPNVKMQLLDADTIEIRVYGSVDRWNAEDWQWDLAEAKRAGAKKILLAIHSSGGSVFDGWAFYNALVNSGLEITTRIDGLAASMASVLALSGSKITMCENALFMIHNPSTYTEGDAEQMRKDADFLDKVAGVILDLYVKKTGQEREVIQTWMSAETWFTAQEALGAGFIHEIITDVMAVDKSVISKVRALDLSQVISGYSSKEQSIHFNTMHKNDTTEPQAVSEVDKVIAKVFGGKDSAEYESAKTLLAGIAHENATLKAKNAELENRIADMKADALEAILMEAKHQGKISDTEMDTYRRIGATNMDDLKVVLSSKKAVIKPLEIIREAVAPAQGSRASWDYKMWSEQDPDGLERMVKTDPARFERLQNAFVESRKKTL